MYKTFQGYNSNSASCSGSTCTDNLQKNNSSCETRFNQKPWVGSHKPSRDTCLAWRHTWCSANKHNRTTCLALMEFEWIAFWHSINSTLSHSDSQNKHSKTQLSRTPYLMRKKPQETIGDVFHQKHRLLTYTSTDIPGFTHHTRKHLRHMRETNNSKQTQGTKCDDAQCTVKSGQEKLLSVNSDLETKLRILYFARHVPKSWSYWVRCGTPLWFAWQNMVQELAAGPSSPIPMWQTVRNQICNDRSTSAKHTGALPWTQTPNHDNFIQKLIWNSLLAIFQFAASKIERNVSLSTTNNGSDLTTYHYKRPR